MSFTQKMGNQRQTAKGKGYVGGFLQLFDWNAKSRKKLFSNYSDNPDQTKQKKRSDGNLPSTRFNLMEMDVDEYVTGSSFKGSSEYSCASSVTDEEGFGSKAPSVIARLMGLDSMPTSNLSEPFSTPFLESQYVRQKLEFRHENHDMYSGDLRNKVEKTTMMNRPIIEKFQSEILPPKSAKTIPITHHKLLSPIKTPGFISSKDAAHIMEAAAKIIEPGPHQASSSKTKMPSVGSSSVPFKVRELREKVETSRQSSRRRPAIESNAAKALKGQPMNKSWNSSPDYEERLGANNNKNKSISLALQAKVNVQKRESRKEPSDIKINQKSIPRKPFNQNSSGALKQNNQKQNCLIDKEKLNMKSSISNSQTRLKISSGDSRFKNQGKFSGNSKVGSRKLSPEANDSKQEVLYSNTKNVPRKRRSLDGNFTKNKNQIVDSMLIDSDEKKPIESEERKNQGMDVVSFTFTAPLSRQTSVFGSDYRSENPILSSDFGNNGNLSSVKCNGIGADDLSVLLDQKLRELTQERDESSKYRDEYSGISTPSFQNLAQTPNGNADSSFTSSVGKGPRMSKYKLQGSMEVDECISDDTETRKSLHYRHPSPMSVLDPSFNTSSWNSSDTVDTVYIEGCNIKQGSYRNPHFMEIDTELTDSASSSSTKALLKGKSVAISTTSNTGSKWELRYINKILFNIEFMFKEFALGRTCHVISPHLFDQLENRNKILKETPNENKLARKVLFDCVSEYMDLRCKRYTNGGFKAWEKGLASLRRRANLAEDVYKEILRLKGIEDSKVDDLVDNDMSSQFGKWLDFEAQAFELGIEIEGRILNTLINEIVTDLVIR